MKVVQTCDQFSQTFAFHKVASSLFGFLGSSEVGPIFLKFARWVVRSY